MSRPPMITTSSSDPPTLRRRALRDILRPTAADAAFYYGLHERDGTRYLGDAVVTGPSGGDIPVQRVVGVPIPAGAAGSREVDCSGRRGRWDVRAPLRRQRNRFLRLDDDLDRAAFERTPVWSTFYAPAFIEDHVRALIYDGDVFVGWIGVFRQGARFSPAARDALNLAIGDLRALLVTAHQIEVERSGGAASYATFDAHGRLLYATPSASRYLSGSRMGPVRSLVRRLDAGSVTSSPYVSLGAIELRVIRLDAPEGVRYLAVLDLANLPRISPIAALSPMQRRVAGYAAVGATVAEISDAVGSSVNTVKYHLKAVYRRLGVGCRAELAQLWAEELGSDRPHPFG